MTRTIPEGKEMTLHTFVNVYHHWGSPRYDSAPVQPGKYEWEERTNPAIGTPLDYGVCEPTWLFIKGTTLGAARSWIEKNTHE